jgi:N-carbamoyl-L-amino-acid hydrolase
MSAIQRNLSVNKSRLWNMHLEMAKIGPGVAGGNNRQALTDDDRMGRDLFKTWCEAADMTVSIDTMGNMFARRAGTNQTLPPVLAGSHLDTQPTGGRFDGVFGVLAALEAVQTMNDLGIKTERPIEIVNWTNEEGSRFGPPMMGSAVFAGALSEAEAKATKDQDGFTMGEALKEIDYVGKEPTQSRPVHAFIECHIEQGPFLEREDKAIGVVTGVQAMRWYKARVLGEARHAGTTPPSSRKDALTAAAKLVLKIDEIMQQRGDAGRCTVGIFQAFPGSPNVCPDRVEFTVDMRNPTSEELNKMDREFRRAAEDLYIDTGCGVEIEEIWFSEPVHFDQTCIDAIRRGANEHGHPWRDIMSGAGHDAVNMARIAPSAMIFIPCKDGISHNEAEYSSPEAIAAGADVLLSTLLDLAGPTT